MTSLTNYVKVFIKLIIIGGQNENNNKYNN